jgi:hypothetical protein
MYVVMDTRTTATALQTNLKETGRKNPPLGFILKPLD